MGNAARSWKVNGHRATRPSGGRGGGGAVLPTSGRRVTRWQRPPGSGRFDLGHVLRRQREKGHGPSRRRGKPALQGNCDYCVFGRLRPTRTTRTRAVREKGSAAARMRPGPMASYNDMSRDRVCVIIIYRSSEKARSGRALVLVSAVNLIGAKPHVCRAPPEPDVGRFPTPIGTLLGKGRAASKRPGAEEPRAAESPATGLAPEPTGRES